MKRRTVGTAYRTVDEFGKPSGPWVPLDIQSINWETGVVTCDPPVELDAGQNYELRLTYGDEVAPFGRFEVYA